MFERLGSITFRYRFAILVLWIAGAVGSVLFAPSLAKEGMTDQSKFLPATAPAVQARLALEAAFPGSTSTSSATLSFSRDSGLTVEDRAYIEELAAWLASDGTPSVIRDSVAEVATAESRPELESMLRSEDGRLDLMSVNLDVATASGGAQEIVTALRAKLAADAPARPGLAAHVTGAAAISGDYLDAVVKGTDSTTAVTVVLVIVILLLIYRAPLAALVPLITIGAAFLVARGVLGILAAAGWQISSLLDTFIVVLIFGVGTDYAIFLISRYREEVAHDNWHHAARVTVRRIGAVITASAATVMVGLGSMAFAEFGMIQSMGPALAIAIGVTLIAGLTLTPALLSIFGHYLFWPLHRGTAMGDPGGFFARLAEAVSKRPGIVTLGLLVALAIPATYVTSMETNFDVLSELPSDSDARAGFDDIASHMGRGKVVQATGVVDAGPGVDILSPASLARLRDLSQDLVGTDGVATVTSLVSPDGDGVVPDGLRPSKQLAEMADGMAEDDSGSGDAADSEALLEDDVTEGLDTAREYLGLLGLAFPDVAVTTAYRTATARLDTARDHIDQARESADVAGQLRTLSRSMTSPTAAAGGDDADTGILGDYLDELAVAYPEVRAVQAFDDATGAAASLEKETSIAAALDLSSAFSGLATWFDDNRPDATLFPESLAGTEEAKQRKAEVTATFDALPGDLTALAAVFADRSDDVFVPVGLSGETGEDVRDAVDAFVSGDRTATRFYVTTSDDPYALRAFDGIRRAQATVSADGAAFGASAAAYLGGATADFADVQTVMSRDFERVGVITVVGILVVLVLLLRAFVAPLYLVATVLLSCATALGLSAWYFQEIQGDAGVSFYLPLLVFVLLVALGSDYNIFLMSRVREESEKRPIREGIRVASGRTGAVITSAGLILAGTFGSMATAELAVLFQVGVAVALGVLIDTFIVRSILVPAITTLFGDVAWWPFGRKGVAGAVAWPVVVTVPEAGAPVEATATAAAPARSRRRLAVALAMVVLVPVAIAGLAAWSLADTAGNIDRVTAAVVNEDRGATVTSADGTEQRLRLGEDLAGGLLSGAGTDTFTWVEVADAAEAREGLTDGRYGAVLTIPSDFSRTIATIRAAAAGGEATAAAQRAKLQLETNDATSYLLGSIARSISDTIALSAAEQVTAAYVDDVLLSVTNAQGRMAGTAADADGVAAGSTDLASGASTVSSVAGELVTGLEEMASGTSDASAGFDKLAAGIDQLAIGTRKIATGASKLRGGTQAAADGSTQLAAGAESLAGGLDTLYSGTAGLPGVDELPGQTQQLAEAAAGVAAGVDATAGGLGDYIDQALVPLGVGASQVGGFVSAEVLPRTGSVAGHALDRASQAGGLATEAGTLLAECATLGGTPELCARVGTLATDAEALATQSANLAAEAGEANAYADQLPGMIDGLQAGISGATAGAHQLHDGITQPVPPAPLSLQDAAGLVEQGATGLAAGMPALADGVSDLASGAGDLADGLSAYARGMAQLANGADALASGAGLTADGAARIAGGTSEAADGASELAGVVDEVVDAGRLVQAEADGLAEDGRSVADDASDLADALKGDAAAIPTWSKTDRQTLGGVVANPVDVESTRLNALGTTGAGLAPLFMAIALWVGALAAYLVLPPFVATARRQRRWSAALAGFLAGAAIGIAQAVLMVAVLALGSGIEIARLPELFAFAILVAVTAVAVAQVLVAMLGMRGWLLALVFVALQVAASGGWFPVEASPAFFGALHPLLPMTYAVEGFRVLIAGGEAALAPAVAVHLLWLGGALAGMLAVATWRTRGGPREVAPAAA